MSSDCGIQEVLTHLDARKRRHYYAIIHRTWEIYQDLCFVLFERIQCSLHGAKRRCFKNGLLGLDAATMFPEAPV